MSNIDRGELGRTTLREQASLRMAESMMRNYRNGQQALLDLVDNAVDNRIEGQALRVQVRLSRGQIVIRNDGGAGLDLQGLQNFLFWGHSEKTDRDIGQYGVGGKAAIGFLGTSLTVACSAQGSDVEYFLSDPDWRNKGEVQEKEHTVIEKKPHSVDKGYFIATITGVDKRVDPKLFATKLGSVYRPLLERKQVSMVVYNNSTAMEVVPAEIRYMMDSPEFAPETAYVENGYGHIAEVRVGILDQGQKADPGLTIFYRGREVRTRETFGMIDQSRLPQASRFHGEVLVNDINVTTNKSDVIEDAIYDDTGIAIKTQVLDRWEAKLPNLNLDQISQIEDYEMDIVRGIKTAIDSILPTVDSADPDWMRVITALGVRQIGSGGTPGGGGKSGTERGISNPRDGDGRTDRREDTSRTKKITFDEIQPVSMHDIGMRAAVITEGAKEILRINTDYPPYAAFKRAGESALEHYVIETTMQQLILKHIPEISPREYDKALTTCLGEVVKNYEENKSRQRAEANKKKKATSKGKSK